MKKLLFGCALAVSGLVMPAANANFGGPMGCDPCCSPCDAGSFDGLYVGGNLGVATNHFERNDLNGFLTDFNTFSFQETNFTAGVQLGYDWQCGNRLAGLVVDWNWVDHDRTLNTTSAAGGFIEGENNWFTTIRGRFGLTVCDALIYVTLGGVVSRFETTIGTTALGSFNDRHCRWGWAGGVGTEWLLGCNWSLGAEVLVLNYCDHNHREGLLDSVIHDSDHAWVGRILLNYRFGDLCGCW